MAILPDTAAIIEVLEGSESGSRVRRYMKKDRVVLSAINIYEILVVVGRKHSKKVAKDFVRSLENRYDIIPVDAKVASLAAQIRQKHKLLSNKSHIATIAIQIIFHPSIKE